jgi:precorrin-2/cobalt-factor-2 C20-methyltransferase
MTYDQEKLKKARDQAALKIKKKLKERKSTAFITIGDPMLYSTYIYILKRLKNTDSDFKINTIPGISSISASTAQYNLPLAKNDENIAILTEVKNEAKYEQIFQMFDNVVIMKLCKNLERVNKLLKKMKLKENVFLISRCGQGEEFYTDNLDEIEPEDVDYLSLIITKKVK